MKPITHIRGSTEATAITLKNADSPTRTTAATGTEHLAEHDVGTITETSKRHP